jgi:hypothetical protein
MPSDSSDPPEPPNQPAALCYLCGQPLSDPITPDHVPPQQLLAPEIRRGYTGLQLLTIPVHHRCNQAFQYDEDYFLYSLFPFVRGSEAGDALYRYVLERFRRGKKAGLAYKVLNEFRTQPGDIAPPPGKLIKRFEAQRFWRVAWKIVRGLHFHHHQEVLPENLTISGSITLPDQEPPEHFKTFIMDPIPPESHGRYPGVFDYRFRQFKERALNAYYWALLLWDKVILAICFCAPEG